MYFVKKPDILLQTTKDFKDCRNQEPHQDVPIQDSLCYRAVQLIETCPTTQATKSLRVGGSQTKSWRQQFTHHSEILSEFITLSVSTESISSNSLGLELELPENTSLFIQGDVTVDLFRTLIQAARS